MCANFRIKTFSRNDVIVETGNEIRDLVFIRNGALKIDKWITFEKKNFWPAQINRNTYDNEKKFEWDEKKLVQNLELTILKIPSGSFFGLQEIQQDEVFKHGNLIVASEEATLLYINKTTFLEIMTPKEIEQLQNFDTACVKYPEDKDVMVKLEAEAKFKRMRTNHLMNAVNVNKGPTSERDYDFVQRSQSPSRSMKKWMDVFTKTVK